MNHINKIVTFKGKKYITVKEEKSGSCSGCALTYESCAEAADKIECGSNRVILNEYTDEERTFTKDELINIAVEYFYPCYGETSGLGEDVCRKDFQQHVDEFLTKEKLKRDPDYQKYLELKKRFE